MTPTPHPNPIPGKPVEEFWLGEEYPFDAPWFDELRTTPVAEAA